MVGEYIYLQAVNVQIMLEMVRYEVDDDDTIALGRFKCDEERSVSELYLYRKVCLRVTLIVLKVVVLFLGTNTS